MFEKAMLLSDRKPCPLKVSSSTRNGAFVTEQFEIKGRELVRLKP